MWGTLPCQCTSLSQLHSSCLCASVFSHGSCISSSLSHNMQCVVEVVCLQQICIFLCTVGANCVAGCLQTRNTAVVAEI